MTVAVPSYNRRESVLRLVLALDGEARREPEAWDGIDVLVVLDGSTDGSLEALEALETFLSVTVHHQENRGRSSARETCLHLATGEIVCFFDDDLVPAAGTVLRHRDAHADRVDRVVMGPTVIPEDHPAPEQARQWWLDRNAKLAAFGTVTDFAYFSVQNASGPVALFRRAGGFDPRFKGYGYEDYELGIRVLGLGVPVAFDETAVAWHYSDVDEHLGVDREREMGRNAVLLVRTHPDAVDGIFPSFYEYGFAAWLIDVSRCRSPRVLSGASRLAESVAPLAERFGALAGRQVRGFAHAAANAAGVAELDPHLVTRALGRPVGRTRGVAWKRRQVG